MIAKFFQKTMSVDNQTLIASDLTLKKLISLGFAGNPFVIVNKCRFEQVNACLMRILNRAERHSSCIRKEGLSRLETISTLSRPFMRKPPLGLQVSEGMSALVQAKYGVRWFSDGNERVLQQLVKVSEGYRWVDVENKSK